jgi:hypothetical protein
MALTMRPTGLSSGIDKDRPHYTVSTGEWEVGRIYQSCGGPRQSPLLLVADHHRSHDPLRPRGDPRGGQSQFQKSWDT